MTVLSDIANTVGANLASYTKNAWSLFLEEASMELEATTSFYTLGSKKVTLLNNNLSYISASTSVVFGESTPDDFQGRAEFTYYDNTEGPLKKVSNKKPLLADPSNDKKDDIKDNYKPYIDKGTEVTSFAQVGKKKINFTYNEHQVDTLGFSGSMDSQVGLLEQTDYDSISSTNKGSLIGKTNRWMKEQLTNAKDDYIGKRFKTTISRFHTSNESSDIEELDNSVGNSAYSRKYGMSHGRNLLKTDIDPTEPYDNPYCRVWTYHHQYNRLVTDTMRPFNGVSMEELDDGPYNWSQMRATSYGDNFPTGGKRLQEFGVMYDNDGETTGLLNITPKWGNDSAGVNGAGGVNLKHCMFSIENLAWKDMFTDYSAELEEMGLSNEQKGPFGGRIMWFPPYNLKFSENTNAKWNQNEFIGRGEPMFTYSNTTRNGNLSFTLLIDHPSILDYWEKRDEVGDPNQSGVDDIDSKEQMMLRFFAGCEILNAKEPPAVKEPEPEPKKPTIKSTDKVIQFFVFFPNNYSGKDDKYNGPVPPVEYLMRGVGTQQESYSAKTNGDKVAWYTKDLEMYDNSEIKVSGTVYGGYELRDGIGISTVTAQTYNNNISFAEYQFEGVTSATSGVTLTKMMSSKTKNSTPEICDPDPDKPWSDKKKKAWNKKRYYYRADSDTLDQVLVGDANEGAVSYIDKTSYQLNSKGLGIATNYWGISNTADTYSLAEMYTAINGTNTAYSEEFCREDALIELKEKLESAKGKITKISFKGRASSQANNKSAQVNTARNNTLAKNRASSIRAWLKSKLDVDSSVFENIQYTFDHTKNEKVQDDSNDKYAKLNRFCFVEIHYTAEEVEDASLVNVNSSSADSTVSMVKTDTSYDTYINKYAQTETAQTESSVELDEVVISGSKANIKTKTVEETQNKKKTAQTVTKSTNTTKRYDDEAKFFTKFKKNDPAFAKLLSERVKYFDPAFHSMSPEGFNARLTFLQQCMRQGPTISNSDTLSSNATNLAFGRPPVCILRIGDFYYTKIIIDSLSISYDPLQWDLNQEGIGVMPMMANITLNFNFIGGSELAGPIQRLQNALSFNYYANTSVYDNRSEIAKYKDNSMGEVEAFKPFVGQLGKIE